jgi:hypothetical protein
MDSLHYSPTPTSFHQNFQETKETTTKIAYSFHRSFVFASFHNNFKKKINKKITQAHIHF